MHFPSSYSRFAFMLATVVFLGVRAAMPAVADDAKSATIDRGFQERSKEILDQLKSKGYKNIGILKFRVKKGDDPISDSVGTLNMFLADRLEMALILANPNDADKQIGIIKKASQVAVKISGASHVTAAGREKLFQGEYKLAWGDQSVKPDAFLTGVAQISSDMKTITVGILVFDQTGGALTKIISPFDARTTPAMLGEGGESYTLRGAFDSAKLELVQATVAAAAAKVKTAEAVHPLADPASPVLLEVIYDGKPAPIEFREGKAFVKEPQEGQKVTLLLKRTSHAKGRLGVVVKVNGESTLERQRLRDVECRKWILEPDSPPISLVGYQVDANVAEEFRVLSQAESSAAEVNYGADVGMISISVFREVGGVPLPESPGSKKDDSTKTVKAGDSSSTPPSDLPPDTAEDLAALSRGVYPKGKTKNLAALKFQLREGGRDTGDTRGLIAQGRRTENATRIVQFVADPTPIIVAAINYYSAKPVPKPNN